MLVSSKVYCDRCGTTQGVGGYLLERDHAPLQAVVRCSSCAGQLYKYRSVKVRAALLVQKDPVIQGGHNSAFSKKARAKRASTPKKARDTPLHIRAGAGSGAGG